MTGLHEYQMDVLSCTSGAVERAIVGKGFPRAMTQGFLIKSAKKRNGNLVIFVKKCHYSGNHKN